MFETAQHEAAHIVVGARLGLRFKGAGLGPLTEAGYADFWDKRGDRTAQAIMIAAGIGWDRMFRFDPYYSSYDYSECWKLVRGRQSVEACVTAATAMLGGLMPEHGRVTRALLIRDLREHDLSAAMRGGPLDDM